MIQVQVTREAGKVTFAQIVERGENRNDWKTLAAAQEVAYALGAGFVATDAGPHVSPRYDVIKLPAVGDLVSYAFNGDSYPCGKIVKISGSLRRVEAREENGSVHVFFRRRLTGSWIKDGTWSLVAGHVSTQNPSF